ncbi:MAG: GtrA family protein [Clostridiaceae bacterium]|nr:GtrA family protein [Clostridiaceae bacterium]
MQKLWQRLRAILLSDKIQELLRYAVIGALTTAVSFGSLWFFVNITGINANIANILSIVCAVVFAYVANKLVVFRTHCRTRADLFREAVSFFAARGLTMLVEAGGFSLLYEICGIQYMISKGIISVLILVLNYVLSKWVVFRKQKKQS